MRIEVEKLRFLLHSLHNLLGNKLFLSESGVVVVLAWQNSVYQLIIFKFRAFLVCCDTRQKGPELVVSIYDSDLFHEIPHAVGEKEKMRIINIF